MTTSNKKTSRKAPTARSKVRLMRDDSMAKVMDKIVMTTKDTDKIQKRLAREATKRGVHIPTLGQLRNHVRYRQARGQLTGVALPETRN